MLHSDFIAALVALNTAAGDRVHHQQVPQGVELPFIAVAQVTGNRPVTTSGQALFARAGLRVAIFAESGVDSVAIASAVVNAFNGFRGVIGTTTLHSSRVETASEEASFVDGDKVIKGSMLDVFVLYQE